ncbi:hypothetical protein BDZ91DRAFT_723765 [Kalaharituber pfeilii]|nr:hypothetical protein BDZ91DRAFT_723765 [Kalaharituber pfeilii]
MFSLANLLSIVVSYSLIIPGFICHNKEKKAQGRELIPSSRFSHPQKVNLVYILFHLPSPPLQAYP